MTKSRKTVCKESSGIACLPYCLCFFKSRRLFFCRALLHRDSHHTSPFLQWRQMSRKPPQSHAPDREEGAGEQLRWEGPWSGFCVAGKRLSGVFPFLLLPHSGQHTPFAFQKLTEKPSDTQLRIQAWRKPDSNALQT